jgi:hypothetical protein
MWFANIVMDDRLFGRPITRSLVYLTPTAKEAVE